MVYPGECPMRLKRMCFAAVVNILYMAAKFKFSNSLLVFCLYALSIIESGKYQHLHLLL